MRNAPKVLNQDGMTKTPEHKQPYKGLHNTTAIAADSVYGVLLCVSWHPWRDRRILWWCQDVEVQSLARGTFIVAVILVSSRKSSQYFMSESRYTRKLSKLPRKLLPTASLVPLTSSFTSCAKIT